jgi:hypothetical protein
MSATVPRQYESMNRLRPRHVGHVYEVVRTVCAVAQVGLTVFIALKVSGVI